MDLSTNRLRWTAVAAVVAAVVAPQHLTGARAAAVPAPQVTCAACILVDDTGRVLFAHDADVERPNASTTKMVTALVVMRESDAEEPVMVSSNAAATGGGGLDLQPGERYTVGGLLYALLLSSSNDSAVALAEHVAGSEAAFVERMNALTRRLGVRHTHFANAHGLDAPGHYSSARDLARIATALLRRPVLAEIVATSRTTIPGPGGSVPLENRNVLLEGYPGAIGVKTGYTAGAGDTLVAAARRHHRRLIAVAMGSASAASDAAALLDYGWARLARGILVAEGDAVGELVFADGSTPVVAEGTVRGAEHPERVAITLDADDAVALPVG
ncbi:MAG TPA: D-alanyl-D-alanine carboxypeptidase family protein, partial [Actinomycetota bacterium]